MLMMYTWAQGQYISGVTLPDTTKAMVTDLSDPSVLYASTITPDDMRMHLTLLASDKMEGRETGEKGNDMAAEHIANYLKYLGYAPVDKLGGYFQPVHFTFTKWEDTEIYVGEKRYKHLWDYLSFPNKNISVPELNADEVIFLGYGIDDPKYSDYKGVDVRGKVIMINKGEPIDAAEKSYITGSRELSSWSTDIDKKLAIAKKKGVALVLIIEDDIKMMLGENRRKLLGYVIELKKLQDADVSTANHAFISTNIAKDIIGDKADELIQLRKKMAASGKPQHMDLPTTLMVKQNKNVRYLDGRNVLGYLPGSDPDLKDELIIVSAHYDHLGKRGDDVYNGADDNGSGTTTVLELAEAFKLASDAGKGPKRSMLFLWVTGEEKGLLGSEYYSENPVFPLDQTMVDINIDMVGRVDEKYIDNHDYIYVIGSDRLSTDLHRLNEEMNQKYSQLTLDYTYNSESDPNRYYYRSDHYNFAKNGIPSIFFFNGTHADYHRITDTVEKIEFEKMSKVGRHFFHLAWKLANQPYKIVVDGDDEK